MLRRMSRAIFGGQGAIAYELVCLDCCNSRESPRRATKNTFLSAEDAEGRGEGQLLHLFSAEDAEGRGEGQLQLLLPRRTRRGAEKGNCNSFFPRRTRRGAEKGNCNSFCRGGLWGRLGLCLGGWVGFWRFGARGEGKLLFVGECKAGLLEGRRRSGRRSRWEGGCGGFISGTGGRFCARSTRRRR